MEISFKSRISVPPDVLVSEVGGESVFLNLKSESYFGLDEVGTRMWKLLTETGSIQTAYDSLLAEYETDEVQLRSDFAELIGKLVDNGLVEIANE